MRISKALSFLIILGILCTAGYGLNGIITPVSPTPIPPGFPTAADTGIAGVGLTIGDLDLYTGPQDITVSGTVIEDKYIPNGLEIIGASNVTIRRCWIGAKGCYAIDNSGGGSGHVIEDCTMVGQECHKRLGAAIRIGGYTLRRCDISRYHDGAKFGNNVVVEDTYIHNLLREQDENNGGWTHNDCLQTRQTTFARLSHNTLQGPYGYTNAAIFFAAAGGDCRNVTIEDSFLSAAGYTMYIEEKNGYHIYDSVIRNCVWDKDAWTKGPMAGSGSSGVQRICLTYHTGELTAFSQPCGGNQSPSANAGSDQDVIDNDRNDVELVTLDGSSSYDNDGTIVSYVWKEGVSQIATGVNPNVEFGVGAHIISLTVTDNNDANSTDNVVITIIDPDAPVPPVADAGVDVVVIDTDENGSETVVLDGSGSYDPDRSIVSYVWKEGATTVGTGVSPSVAFDIGFHSIDLTVTDENDLTDTDTVGVTVQSPGALTSTETWQSQPLDSTQTGEFTVEFDSIPLQDNMNGVTGFAQNMPDEHDDCGCLVRFDDVGVIDVRTGDVYQADNEVFYSVGTNYHFRLEINIPAHTYSVYVTPGTGSEVLLAADYNFRTPQQSATSMSYWGLVAATGNGSHIVDNVEITTGGAEPVANAGPDQLIVDIDGDGNELVTLDGSGSSDVDGTIVSYIWEENDIEIANGVSPQVVLDTGLHSIILTVTDDNDFNDSDIVQIRVVGDYRIPIGRAVVNGVIDSAEWSAAEWLDMNEVYSGSPNDLSDAKWAAMWDPNDNLIYVAVTGEDSNHIFTADYVDPNAADALELYIDAGNNELADYNTDMAKAQHIFIGYDGIGGAWSYILDRSADSVLNDYAVSVDGNTITYEVVLEPYETLDIDNPGTSPVVGLSVGDILGLDMVMNTKHSGGFGMVCEDPTPQKFRYADAFRDHFLVNGVPIAVYPNPDNEETDVGLNADLSWIAGDYAQSHDVYFGTSYAEVNDAQRTLGDIDGSGWVDKGDLAIMVSQWLEGQGMADLDNSGIVNFIDFAVLVGQLGQYSDAALIDMVDINSYDLQQLDSLTTYYWRIDEINIEHSNSPWRGDVWQFTTTDVPTGQELQFTPSDDTYTKENNASANFGSDTVLKIRTEVGKIYYSYLKFTVSGAVGTVTSAKLRIRCNESSSQSTSVYPAYGSWSQGTLTWTNDSLTVGALLDSFGSSTAGVWYEFDVTAAVTADGTYSFRMTSPDTSAREWSSKDSAYDPVLIVETNGGL